MQVTIKDIRTDKLLGFIDYEDLINYLSKYRIFIFNTYIQDDVINQTFKFENAKSPREVVKTLKLFTRFNSLMIEYFKNKARKEETNGT